MFVIKFVQYSTHAHMRARGTPVHAYLTPFPIYFKISRVCVLVVDLHSNITPLQFTTSLTIITSIKKEKEKKFINIHY